MKPTVDAWLLCATENASKTNASQKGARFFTSLLSECFFGLRSSVSPSKKRVFSSRSIFPGKRSLIAFCAVFPKISFM